MAYKTKDYSISTVLLLKLFFINGAIAGISPKYMDMPLSDLLTIPVSTTSKYSEKLINSPANIYVFSQQQIRERGYRSIEDILKALPGVDVQNFSRFSPNMDISLHGYTGNNTFLLLQDGVRVSSAGGEVTSISHNFPIYYAQQIEVLMGPAAAAYGADAFLGVINIITNKSALNTVQISAGENNYTQGFAHTTKQIGDDIYFNAGVSGFISQDYRFADDFPEFYPPEGLSPTGREFTFPQDRAHSLMAKLEQNDAWAVGLNISQLTNSTYSSSLPGTSDFDPSNTETTRIANLYGKLENEHSPNLRSSSVLNVMCYEMGNDTNFSNRFTNYQRVYKYAATDRYSFNQDFVYQKNDRHILSFGAVYDWIDSIPVGPDLSTRYNSTSRNQLTYLGTTLPMMLFEYNYENYGLYLQSNKQFTESLRLVGGLRFDHNTFYGDTHAPRLAAIYRLEEDTSVKFLYGEAFLAPSPDTAFRHFGSFSGFNEESELWESSFFRAPNPNLTPEKIRTYEVVFSKGIHSHTQFKIASFYSQIDDALIISGDTEAKQFIPGANIGFTESYKNSGQAKTWGGEAGFENDFRFSSFRMKSWLYYSRINGEIDTGSRKQDLALAAENKIKGGVSFIFNKTARLTQLTPQIYWIDETNSQQADPDRPGELYSVPAYTLLNLHFETELRHGLSLIADIYNSLDNKHTHAVRQGSNLALPEAPQPGRLISAGLRVEL